MAEPISARRMVSQVGSQIENVDADHWSATDTLFAIDQAVNHLYLIEQDAKQDHELDVLDVNVATARAAGQMSATASETQSLTVWRLPDFIYRIRRIENTTAGGESPEIPRHTLHDKEEQRGRRRTASWMWHQGGDARQQISFLGGMSGITGFRVWYVRRIPPLHYGTARSGLTTDTPAVEMASTSARIWFQLGADGAGRLLERGDVYVGSLIEFGSHPTLGNVLGVTDEIRRISLASITLVPASLVYAWLWQFDQLLQHPSTAATLTCAGYEYSLVPQIGQEHHELVVLMAATRLAKTAGAAKNIAIIKGEAADLYEKFIAAVQSRQDQTPDFVQVPHGGWD